MFLSSTARQLVGVVVGNTQASSVMPVVSRREVEFGIVTCAPVPLNTSALPNLPAVVQLAPPIVPVLPLPERSVTAVPAPSLKAYAATRPACAHDWPGRNRKVTQRNIAATMDQLLLVARSLVNFSVEVTFLSDNVFIGSSASRIDRFNVRDKFQMMPAPISIGPRNAEGWIRREKAAET